MVARAWLDQSAGRTRGMVTAASDRRNIGIVAMPLLVRDSLDETRFEIPEKLTGPLSAD
jgi:hypothetical protein